MEEKISDEALRMLRYANSQLEAAVAGRELIAQAILREYKLQASDHLDMATGVITRGNGNVAGETQ